MKTNQITTESGIVLLLVEVPVGANCVKYEFERVCFNHADHMPDYVLVPEGNWQGKHFNEMSEEDCVTLATRSYRHPDLVLYHDPLSESTRWAYLLDSAKEAVSNLIRSNGFDPENTVVLTLK